MIQRVQTLWLLLTVLCCYLTTRFEFYAGTGLDSNPAELKSDTEHLLLLLLTAAIGISSLVTIFLFKQMKLQIRLTLAILLASVILIVLYFLALREFSSGTISIWSIFYFGIPVSLALALNGIMKDDKMVRDMDRFR